MGRVEAFCRPLRAPRVPSGVWVVAELSGGMLAPVSVEALGEGRRRADAQGAELGAVLLGTPGVAIREAARAVLAYGADTVYLIEDQRLVRGRPECFARALGYLAGKYHPALLLIPGTARGTALADMVAVRASVETLAPGAAAPPPRQRERTGHIVIEPLVMAHASGEVLHFAPKRG